MTKPHDEIQARQQQGAARRQPVRRNGTLGIKALITAASVAVTLGGWALLAQEASPTTAAASNSAALATAADQLNLPPIPTVVPAPDLGSGQTETAPRAPSLRSVPAPQTRRAPIAITRSSR